MKTFIKTVVQIVGVVARIVGVLIVLGLVLFFWNERRCSKLIQARVAVLKELDSYLNSYGEMNCVSLQPEQGIYVKFCTSNIDDEVIASVFEKLRNISYVPEGIDGRPAILLSIRGTSASYDTVKMLCEEEYVPFDSIFLGKEFFFEDKDFDDIVSLWSKNGLGYLGFYGNLSSEKHKEVERMYYESVAMRRLNKNKPALTIGIMMFNMDDEQVW